MNTNIRILFFSGLILSLFISQNLYSQPGQRPATQQGERATAASGRLEGLVVDKTTGEPLMFASVVLKRETDSVMVSGSITNEEGRFAIEQLSSGIYFITINFVGYPAQSFNSIQLPPGVSTLNIGTIQMEAIANLLDEITVEGARSLMQTGLDRRIINVGQELTAIGGTGIDLMRNIPSVAVDFDGTISLRGSSNVTILIDGRPATLTGLTGSEALEQIPSEIIERVEVITNPSARFNPEGTSGIINVVLKQQRQPGYNGMASINAGSADRYNGSLNFNYKLNNLNFFANLSGRLSGGDGFGTSFRESRLDGGLINLMNQDLTFTETSNGASVQAGVDYSFDDQNTLTFSSQYNQRVRGSDDLTAYILGQNLSNPSSLFSMNNDNSMAHRSFTQQLYFRRTYDQPLRELIADISFSTRTIDRNENFLQQHFEQNFDTPNGQIIRNRSNLDGNNWSLSARLDYVHPLSETSKFETGFSAQTREMDADFVFENESSPSLWTINPNRSNHFLFDEQIIAVYGMYATQLGKFGVQAGLRAEQTFTTGDQLTGNYEVDQNNYFSLFPTLHVRRNMENNQAVQISYSRRINRPDNRNLNPFIRYNSDFDVSFGNPLLRPEFINSLELGYTRYWEQTTINPSLFYRYTQGMITQFREVRQIDGRDVTVTTPENLNRGISYGAELVISQNLSRWWSMNGTFSYFRNIVQGAQTELENDNYSWSGRLVSNMRLGRGWNLQVNGFYTSPIIMLQGEIDAMYSASAGIRKNIWDNRGSITMNISDIFNTMEFSTFNYGDNFFMNMDRKRTSRYISFGFTYRINEFQRRNNNRNQMMDDENGGGRMMDFGE